MSTQTENLGLTKPQINDNIYQTISDLAVNFQNLSDAADVRMTSSPMSGNWPKRMIWNSDPTIGSYLGWVNVRSGEATPKWTSLTSYNVGTKVSPTSDNSHYYTCIQSGSSGINEPVWPLTSNSTVREISGATFWETGKHYNLNDVVLPTSDNGRFYLCVQAGNTATTQPNWPTTAGSILDDNTTRWRCYVIARWQESGTSANFRPFGLIG